MKHDYHMTIREIHLDTFGHVNNAAYLQIFEEARWEFITSNGYGLKEVQESQKGPVLLEVNIKFKAELKLREKIIIRTEMFPFEGLIAKAKQSILKEGEIVAAEAHFVFAYFDLKLRKLIPPTPDWLKALGLSST